MWLVRVYDWSMVALSVAWPSADAAANQTEMQTLIDGFVFIKILCWLYVSYFNDKPVAL